MKHSNIFLTFVVLGIAAGWPKSDAAPIGFGLPNYQSLFFGGFGNPYGSPLACGPIHGTIYEGPPTPKGETSTAKKRDLGASALKYSDAAVKFFSDANSLKLARAKLRELFVVWLPDGRPAHVAFHVPPPNPLERRRLLPDGQLPDGWPAHMAFYVPPPNPLEPKAPTKPKPRELHGVQLPDGRPAQMTFHAPPPDPLAPKVPIGPGVPIL